jgi:hypothetical protein
MVKKKNVTIKLNFSNKFLYMFVSLVLVVSVLGIVYATWTPTGQYHDSNEVRVTINGTAYSLQEAIDGGLLGDSNDFSLGKYCRCGGYVGYGWYDMIPVYNNWTAQDCYNLCIKVTPYYMWTAMGCVTPTGGSVGGQVSGVPSDKPSPNCGW